MTIQYLIGVFELGTNTQLMTNVEFEFSGAKDDLKLTSKLKRLQQNGLFVKPITLRDSEKSYTEIMRSSRFGWRW